MGRRDIQLGDIFPRVQEEMLAQFALGKLFEHSVPRGTATEKEWIEFFRRHLPKRYSAASAFVIGADGGRSRQIDIAIYDNLYSPVLFPHEEGIHIPAESVYAVFEVKQEMTPESVRDAARKAASVRMLRRTSAPFRSGSVMCEAKAPHRILAGILTMRVAWKKSFNIAVSKMVKTLEAEERLDFGCALVSGAFEALPVGEEYRMYFSHPRESLLFFFVRLLERLREIGTAPSPDMMRYARGLLSFVGYPEELRS